MPVDVLVPPLGTNTDTLLLVAWLKQEGELVRKDEPLFSVETDKAVLEVEAPASGVLTGIRAAPGDEVAVLSVVASIATPGEAASAPVATPSTSEPAPKKADMENGLEKSPAVAAPVGRPAPARPSSTAPPAAATAERLFSSPRARGAAARAGIDWTTLIGSGPDGAVVERDVETARTLREERGVGESRTWATPESDPTGRLRSASGMFTIAVDTDATAVVELCSALAASGISAAPRDLVVKSVASALRAHPQCHASIDGARVQCWTRVHVGVAVLRGSGWAGSVVRDADTKTLREIVAALRGDFGDGVQPRGIDPLLGQSFTVVDWGESGLDCEEGALELPNWPQISLGTLRRDAAGSGRHRLRIALTVDSRLIERSLAARLLSQIEQGVLDPVGLLA